MLNPKKGISRRELIKAGAAFTGMGLLTGLNIRQAAAAQELRIIMSGGSWHDWVNKVFAEPFAKANHVGMIWKLGLSQEPLIMVQRSHPQWDMMQSNQSRATQLGSMGLYRKYTEKNLPNLSKINPAFRCDYLAGMCHTPYGLCVNTRKIKRPIDSWLDLWDPAFKGHVGFPAWDWIGDEVFQAITIALGGTSGNVEPGINKFKSLFKDNACQQLANVEHTRQLLDAEEVWLCPFFDARTRQAAAAGLPVEFVIPKEGGMSWIWNNALIANRPGASMELADKFTDTTLAPQAQIDFARLTGYPPTNMEAMKNLPSDLKQLALTDTQIALLNKLQSKTNYVVWFNNRNQYAERWNKEVLGAK